MDIQGQEGLYDFLNSQELYTKSLEEFKDQFSDPEKQSILYDRLSSNGLYDKSEEEFTSQFFGVEKKNPIETEEVVETETIQPDQVEVQSLTEEPIQALETPIEDNTDSQQASEKPKSSSAGGMMQMATPSVSESQKPKKSDISLLLAPKGKPKTPAEAVLEESKKKFDVTAPGWFNPNKPVKIDIPTVTKNITEASRNLAQQSKTLDQNRAQLEIEVKAFENAYKTNPNNPNLPKLKLELDKKLSAHNALSNQFQLDVSNVNQDQAELKKAMAEKFIDDKDKGSFLGATWNSIVEGYKKIGEGQTRMAMDLMVELFDRAGIPWADPKVVAQKKMTKDDAKKELIGTMMPILSKGYDVAKSEGTTEAYIQQQKTKGVLPKAWFGAMESIPVMATGGTIPRFVTGASMAFQYANDELDSNPNTANMDENERKKITVPIAVIGGVLEEIGFRTLIGKNKPYLIQLSNYIIKQLPKNATLETIKAVADKAVKGPIMKQIVSTGSKLGTAYLGEAETGGSQKALDVFTKEIYDAANNVDFFNNPEILSKEFLSKVGEDANLEGLGGIMIRGMGLGASAAMSVTGIGQMSDKEYAAWKDLMTRPNSQQIYLSDVISDLAKGKIDQQEASKRISNFDRSQKILDQLDLDAPVQDQKKAFAIITANEKLQNEIDDLKQTMGNMHPMLAKNRTKQIEALEKKIEDNNNQLSKLSENAVQEQTTSEVPVQPEAGTSQQMAEGEPQAEPQVPTQEGQGQEVAPSGGGGMIQMATPEQTTPEQPTTKPATTQEVETITANIPKQDLPKVMDLVSRIENGKDTSSPDDLQTQQNYAKEIEQLLAKRASEKAEPSIPKIDVKTPTQFEKDNMPEVPVSQIDWEASNMGSEAEAIDSFGGINNITVVDVRGKNEQGQYTGKVRVTGQDSSREGVVVFNDPDAPRKPTVGRKRNASPKFEMAEKALSDNGVYPSFENVEKIVEITNEKPGNVTAEDIQNVVKLGNKKAKAIADALNKPKTEGQKVPEQAPTETIEQPVEELPLSEAPTITEVEEEKPAVPFTEEPKKSPFSSIPGYDRMMGEIKGIIDKSFKRGVSFNQTLDNAIQYMSTSKVYEDADDTQREEMVREVRKMFDKKEAKNKSLQSMKLKEPPKKALVDTKKQLYERLKEIDQSIKEGQRNFKKAVKDMAAEIKGMLPKGVFSTRQVKIVANALSSNLLNPKLRQDAIDRVNRMVNNVAEATKLKEAYDLRTKIKNANIKNLGAELQDLAKGFGKIDPRYIENLDEHLEQARQVFDAIRNVKFTKDEDGNQVVDPRSIIPFAPAQDYTQKQLDKQEEIMKDALLQQHANLVEEGKINDSMSLAQIQAYVNSIAEDPSKSKEEKDQALRDYAQQSFNESKEELEDAIDDGAIDEDDLPLIEGFTKIDLSLLDPMQAYEAAEALMNYRVNGSTSKMGKVLANYVGALGAKTITENVSRDGKVNVGGTRYLRYKAAGKVLDKLIQGLSFGKIKPNLSEKISTAYSDLWLELNGTLDNLGVTYFGPNNWKAIKEASGLDDIISGVVERKKIIEVFTKEIHDKYKNKKIGKDGVFTTKNAYMLDMISNLYRETSDPKQKDTYFNDRKKVLKETIDYLKSSEDADEQKEGELLEEIYNELGIEDATSGQEVFDNADPVAKQIINDFINKFKQYYPDFSRIAQEQFNVILGQDNNYTADSWRNVGKSETSAADKLFKKGNFTTNNDIIETEATGRFTKPKYPSTLPKRNGKVTRIPSFDFFKNQMNALSETINTVKTINGVNQYTGFVDSPNFNKLITDEASRNFFKDRVNYNVSLYQMNEKVGKRRGYTKAFVDLLKIPTKIGTTVGLSSIQSLATQSLPIITNTVINLRNPTYMLLAMQYGGNPAMQEFLNNLNYGITERGHSAQTNIDYANNMLERGDYSTPEKTRELLKKASRVWVDKVLVGTDVLTAKATWMAYYMDELAKQGVNPMSINWANHEVNDKAAKYAETMVQREQNVNLPESGGKLWSSKDSRMRVARMMMPFASFTTSQKDKIKANMSVLFMDNNLATKEEKIAAAKSIVASAGEQYVFNGIKSYITGQLVGGAYKIVGKKETEEEEKLRKKKESSKLYADIFDAFNGSVDFLEKESGAIVNNFLMRATENLMKFYDDVVERNLTKDQLIKEIKKMNWAADNKIEKDEVQIYPFGGPRAFKTQEQIKRGKLKEELKKPFRFYESEEASGPETVARMFGGVPLAAYNTWARFVTEDLPDIVTQSTATKDGSESKLTKEEVGKLLMAIPIKVGAGLGPIPREIKNLSDYTTKIIKDKANMRYQRRKSGRKRLMEGMYN